MEHTWDSNGYYQPDWDREAPITGYGYKHSIFANDADFQSDSNRGPFGYLDLRTREYRPQSMVPWRVNSDDEVLEPYGEGHSYYRRNDWSRGTALRGAPEFGYLDFEARGDDMYRSWNADRCYRYGWLPDER
jgi:hypothetical protein